MDVRELARTILAGGHQFAKNTQRGLQSPQWAADRMQTYIQENPMAVVGMTAPVGEFRRIVKPQVFDEALTKLREPGVATLDEAQKAQDIYNRVVQQQLLPEEIKKLSSKPEKLLELIQKRLRAYE